MPKVRYGIRELEEALRHRRETFQRNQELQRENNRLKAKCSRLEKKVARSSELEITARLVLDSYDRGEKKLVDVWGKKMPPYAEAWGCITTFMGNLRTDLCEMKKGK